MSRRVPCTQQQQQQARPCPVPLMTMLMLMLLSDVQPQLRRRPRHQLPALRQVLVVAALTPCDIDCQPLPCQDAMSLVRPGKRYRRRSCCPCLTWCSTPPATRCSSCAIWVGIDQVRYRSPTSCLLTFRSVSGTVLGCLRKVQRWNLASIFEEYRRYAGDKRLLNEQFIELFDTDLVRIPVHGPRWL